MTMSLRVVAITLLLMVCAMGEAAAQTPMVARVVTTCGTLPTAYVAGSNRPVVQDVNGNFCTNASGGGGGGAVTLASGAVASGAYSSGSIASGAFSSGSVASGAFASGSLAAGSMVDFLTVRGTKAPGTAAANSVLNGCVYTSAGITLTDGQQAACQFTSTGAINVNTASSALPTGAATAANQTTEIASLASILTAIQGDVPSVTGPLNAATAAATKMLTTGCQYLVSLPTYTNTQQGGCTFDVNGRLLVAIAAGSAVNATLSTETTKVIGTVNIAAAQTMAVTNAGTFAVQPSAAETHIGEIGSNQIRVDVAQTVTASSAYTSGNAIGGLMTVAGATRVSGSLGASGTGGIIQQVAANSKSLQTTQVDVFLFNSNPTGSTCTDKTAFVLATADFDKVIGVASIPGTAANNSGWFGGGTGSVGQANNLAMAFDLASATTIYACAVTRGTPTFTATSDISFKYQILRN